MRPVLPIVAVCLLVGGCTASMTPPAAPSPSSLVSSAPADPLASAVDTTTSTGSAALHIVVLTTVDGVDYEVDGDGVAHFASGDADITWQSAAGSSREITADGVGYVQIEPPNGDWIALDTDESVPTLGAGQPLSALSDLADVRVEGAEEINGIQTTRYTGWIPARDHLGGLGINDIDARGVTDDPTARINITAWVDSAEHIVRVMRTLDSQSGIAASSTTELHDFGTSAAIDAPAAN